MKLLTEHHLEFLSLKGACTGSSNFPTMVVVNFVLIRGNTKILTFLSRLITPAFTRIGSNWVNGVKYARSAGRVTRNHEPMSGLSPLKSTQSSCAIMYYM